MAKQIKNKPQVNSKVGSKAYLKEMMAEINQLKRENEVLRMKNGIYLLPEQYEMMQSTIAKREIEVQELQAMSVLRPHFWHGSHVFCVQHRRQAVRARPVPAATR